MKRLTIDYWRTIGFALAVIGLGSALYVNSQSIDRNKEAIRTSCTLLVNTIIESGVNNDQDGGRNATQLFVVAIKRVMTPTERVQLDAALKGSGSSRVTLPPCDRIAEHPETVKAKTPTPSPSPTP